MKSDPKRLKKKKSIFGLFGISNKNTNLKFRINTKN